MKHHYILSISILFGMLLSIAISSGNAQQADGNSADISLRFAQPETGQINGLKFNPEITDGSVAYGNNVWTNDLFSIDTDDPLNINVIGKMTMQTASGDFHPDEPDFMYVIDINTNYLGKIDISSGATVDSVLVPVPVTDGIWTVLTIHKTTGDFYGVATNGSESNLYEINPDDGSTTLAFNTGLSAVISGTFDASGMIWLFEIANNDIYKLDLNNDDLEFVGPAGFNGNFAQGMGYDPQDNMIYLAAYEEAVGPQLRMLNTSTGEATLIADLPGETTAFGFPNLLIPEEMYSVSEVYDNPSIQNGDAIIVFGDYTNPEIDLLLLNYGDLEANEVYPENSNLVLTGAEIPEDAWDGGHIIVSGTVEFVNPPDPYYPDEELAILDVTDVVVVQPSIPYPFDSNISPNNKNQNRLRPDRDDCDSCKFAIMISGGINHRANKPRYWESLAALYELKVNSQGYCPENILVHYYHGKDSVPDARIPEDQVKPAEQDEIEDSFDEISKRVAECNRNETPATFQKMIFNHGEPDGDINLLGNDTLLVSDLREMQQKIIDSCATTIYDEFLQCYAGYGVDEMLNLDEQQKATIYVNSSADTTTSWSPGGPRVDRYLQTKIDSLANGSDYEDAVVGAKMAYDQFLEAIADFYHQRAQGWRNTAPGWYPVDGVWVYYSQDDIDQQIEWAVQDSASRAEGICHSRNEKIVPFTEYCQWEKFVVPPGGQLVLKFDGEDDNCGNVTVYKSDPVAQQTVKVIEWNWNVEGSAGYQEGNNQRVINGDPLMPCTFWVHNDNNGDYVRVNGSARGNQDLEESPTNENAFAGFSFGGNNGSAAEFDTLYIPEYFYENIDQIPLGLNDLPGYFGSEYVQVFGFSFGINPSDPYWQNMYLHLDILEVMQPGEIDIIVEGFTDPIQVPVFGNGEYLIPIGDLSLFESGNLQFFIQGASFSMDSWGLRSMYGVPLPMEQIIDLQHGWSGISSFVEPENPPLPDLLGPIFDQFTLLQNDQGNLFWPAQGINTLQVWDPSQGYLINMQQEGLLPIEGMLIENPVVFFDEGWNYVPVLVPEPYPADQLFNSVDGFVMAKEVAGPGVFWPQYEINTLGNLMPGHAYNAFSLQPGEAMYEFIPAEKSSDIEPNEYKIPETPWNPVHYSPNSHIVLFQMDNGNLENGDIIGAFTSDNWCAGVAEVVNAAQNTVVSINAFDPSVNFDSGFENGETIRFKLYRPSTHEIFEMNPAYDPEMNTGDFALNGMSVVTSMKMSVTGITSGGIHDVKLYPNPNHGSFTIESNHDKIEVSVFNSFGEVIYHDNFEGTFSIDLNNQPGGTYFVKLSTDTGTRIEKVVIY